MPLDDGLLLQLWKRYNSLINTLEIRNLDQKEYQALQMVINFLTQLKAYDHGFYVIRENPKEIENKLDSMEDVKSQLLEICCVDPTIVFDTIKKRFHHILITSGMDLENG